MAIAYVLGALAVLAANYEAIPEASGPFLSAHLLHRQLWGERPERPLRQR